MKIIPAIDLINGQCVRLEQGDYAKSKVYNADPLDQAKAFEDAGISYLHLVDLDGAKAGKVVNYKIIESIASKTNLIIDFGGGVRTDQDVKIALESGASKLSLGSIAVKNKVLATDMIQNFGADKFILSADVKKDIVQINAWQDSGDLVIDDLIEQYAELGLNEVVCTDISKDGMMQGPGKDLYKRLISKYSKIRLIASGGVTEIQDLNELQAMGCEGAIIGKAIYEGSITLKQLEQYAN
ncbi:1-(5-phosphoribosyl)-5-[(5-phosphoribosylamino)methylideneamino]imidazole-4-carboxamide isomerase [Flavobacteriaceae bacterium]|nr:1-(5-phosphoribosyl)-5-[(5-phosphoribosylamino)methylideneamino]imidazole-4-carboxamide isomerase [Flavobacteriaceae bacterium]